MQCCILQRPADSGQKGAGQLGEHWGRREALVELETEYLGLVVGPTRYSHPRHSRHYQLEQAL